MTHTVAGQLLRNGVRGLMNRRAIVPDQALLQSVLAPGS